MSGSKYTCETDDTLPRTMVSTHHCIIDFRIGRHCDGHLDEFDCLHIGLLRRPQLSKLQATQLKMIQLHNVTAGLLHP